MKRISKRLLACFMVVALLITSVPMTVWAASNAKTVVLKAQTNNETKITYVDEDYYEFDGDYSSTYEESYGYSVSGKPSEDITLTRVDEKAFESLIVRVAVEALQGKILNFEFTNSATGKPYSAQAILISEDDEYVTYEITFSGTLRSGNVIVSPKLADPPVPEYAVTLPTDDRYELDGAASAKEGEDYPFTLTVFSNYADRTPVVTVRGRNLPNNSPSEDASGNVVYSYTVPGELVTRAFSVGVTLNEKKHTITVNKEGEGFQTDALPTATVGNNTNYVFHVDAEPGYEAPEVTAVDSKGASVTVSRYTNTYTIANVTDDYTITIKGGDRATTNVLFSAGYGYTFMNAKGEAISDTESVPYGDPYTFRVKLNEGYTQSAGTMTVAANNRNLSGKLVEGTTDTYEYTISNVTAEQVVTVSNVVKNTYRVTLGRGNGYALSSSDSTTVQHGGTFEFSLTINPGYNGTPTVKAVGASGTEYDVTSSNGTYSVAVTEPITITVAGIGENKYTISCPVGEGYTISYDGENAVGHGESFTFTVASKPGYRITNVNTKIGSAINPLTTIGGNRYTISNITADQTIEVVAVPVTYTVNYMDEKGILAGRMVYGAGSENVDENGKITLRTPNPDVIGEFYTLNGWFDENGYQVTELTLANADESITLTASWTVNWDKLFTVEMTGEWRYPKDGKYTLHLENTINGAKIDEKLLDEIKSAEITAYGVFYSNRLIHEDDATLKGYISNVVGDLNLNGHGSQLVGDKLYLYYTKDVSTAYVEGQYFGQSFSGIKEGAYRSAMAWVQIEMNGETYSFLSEVQFGNSGDSFGGIEEPDPDDGNEEDPFGR